MDDAGARAGDRRLVAAAAATGVEVNAEDDDELALEPAVTRRPAGEAKVCSTALAM